MASPVNFTVPEFPGGLHRPGCVCVSPMNEAVNWIKSAGHCRLGNRPYLKQTILRIESLNAMGIEFRWNLMAFVQGIIYGTRASQAGLSSEPSLHSEEKMSHA